MTVGTLEEDLEDWGDARIPGGRERRCWKLESANWASRCIKAMIGTSTDVKVYVKSPVQLRLLLF